MATERASLDTIEDFLAQKRVAMAGISRDPVNFSVRLFEELCRRGYDVVPVNPNTSEVHGSAAPLGMPSLRMSRHICTLRSSSCRS